MGPVSPRRSRQQLVTGRRSCSITFLVQLCCCCNNNLLTRGIIGELLRSGLKSYSNRNYEEICRPPLAGNLNKKQICVCVSVHRKKCRFKFRELNKKKLNREIIVLEVVVVSDDPSHHVRWPS